MDLVKKLTSILGLALCITLPIYGNAQNYSAQNVKISIYSSAPLEDIKASSSKGSGVLISKSGDVAFQVPVKSLQFEKKLMQEHFNENYMESDTYPLAKFNGKIAPVIDLSKDGEYNITAKGMLSVHGVDKERSIPGKLIVKNGIISLDSSFNVACEDHKIKIPTIVIAKIAEVIQVNVSGIFNQIK